MTLDEEIEELHGIQNANHFRYVQPIPRLGIPSPQVTNGPAGAGPASVDPQAKATALRAPIALAATGDTTLARRYGVIAGRESKKLGAGLLEAPDINIIRVPQNGRTFEAFGEDPFLVARLAVANIEGIQSGLGADYRVEDIVRSSLTSSNGGIEVRKQKSKMAMG